MNDEYFYTVMCEYMNDIIDSYFRKFKEYPEQIKLNKHDKERFVRIVKDIYQITTDKYRRVPMVCEDNNE